jgi:membrane protease YdiL (CAAX protease family)
MPSFKKKIQSISDKTEALIVLIGAFGFLIIRDAYLIYKGDHVISTQSLYSVFVYEVVILTSLGFFIKYRGWTFKSLGLMFQLKDLLYALALYGVFIFFYTLFYSILVDILDVQLKVNFIQLNSLSLSAVLLISVVNPIFEELFLCGYLLSFRQKIMHPYSLVFFSVAIRVSYHLYQNWFVLLHIIPFGIISAIWFLRTKRIWPIIMIHQLIDFFGLLAYTIK